MKVRVKVDEVGYFDLRFRKEGEVFDIPSEKQFSKRWMEKVDPPAPPVSVAPPAPPADPVPPVEPKVEPKPEPPVAPKVEPKAADAEKPDESEKGEGSSQESKPATGDQSVL